MFTLQHQDTATKARAGVLRTAHGLVETPIFMPVGTQGTVKAVHPHELHTLGARIILANTYHLALRPGADLLRDLGGLHRFMHWDRPILTDSGGYQVYSLNALRRIEQDGVTFQSHIDGSYHFISPETSIAIQEALVRTSSCVSMSVRRILMITPMWTGRWR